MEENIEDISSEITYKLDNFEGPLSILLRMIKEHNLTIQEVRLADITDQFLEYVEKLDYMNMDIASEFIDVISTLLEIKSRSLLPPDETEENIEDTPEYQLKMKLINEEEQQLFREIDKTLEGLDNTARFYKQPDKSVGDARIVFNQFNLEKLLDAFAFILMRTKDKEAPQEKKIDRDRWTVADKVAFLNNTLKDNKEINFFSLFDETYSKLEVITVFLAILELLKFQKIEVVQTERYADITIRAKEEETSES